MEAWEFDTKNEAHAFRKEGMEQDVFKDCIHLQVGGGSNAFQSNPYPSPESIELAYERLTVLNLEKVTTLSTTVAATDAGVVQ